MTEKLYDKDAYGREFTATVLSCEEDKKALRSYWIRLSFSLRKGDRRLMRVRLTG